MKSRPTTLVTKQACAAVGQSRLMRVYDDIFSHYNQPIAQVLLSRDNLNQKHHYCNAQNTFVELLRMGIVPIVNENDTVAVEELRVGDNDTLSALVASLIGAEYLVLLTDVDALYTKDPSKHPDAKPIHRVDNLDDIKAEIGDGGDWGTGGMFTKIQAARIAKAAGVTTVVCHSRAPEVIIKICAEHADNIGTVFSASAQQIEGKKKWLAHGLATLGVLWIDDGCRKALLKKSSLFAAGIKKVEGQFASKSNVLIVDRFGQEVARGLVEYSSQEIEMIKGQTSKDIGVLLGYLGAAEVIHRANLVITSAGLMSPLQLPLSSPGA
jgi:glutamate 5-kinase